MNIENLFEKEFRGCTLVTEKNKVIIRKAFGYADLPNKILNDMDTKFATASAGKVFVAVGILQLIERQLLNYKDTIGELLPFDFKQIDRDISVEELLTHTSGIPDYFDESKMSEYEELWIDFPNYKIRANKDLLPLFIDKPMMYPKGSRFEYNNTGFVVLALIIEKITGMDFDKYLAENVFIPSGMQSTGYYELDMLPSKCAVNYIFDEKRGGYKTNIFSVDAKGTGAGGAYTTVADIGSFWNSLLSYKLLSCSMTKNMLSNHSGNAQCYGYGIWLKKTNDIYVPYFQGSDPGVSFITSYDIQKELMVILVSNYGDNVWKIFKKINLELSVD